MPDQSELYPCASFEALILDYVDAVLTPSERARVERHLGQCAACQTFCDEQKALDAMLLASISQPRLPAEFKAQLLEWARSEVAIRKEAPLLPSAANRIEFDSFSEYVRFGRAFLPMFCDCIGLAFSAIIVGVSAARLLNQETVSLFNISPTQLGVYVAFGLGVVSIGAGLWFGFGEQIRQLSEWL